MARYKFLTVDVFTHNVFGGNPLAVFPDATGLSAETMQSIAKEFNLSETAFVLPPDNPAHTRRVRIFTPGTELPFAGHPTLGTAHVLAAIGEVELTEDATEIVFEEGVGPVQVSIQSRDGTPYSACLTAAQAPDFGPAPPDISILAEVLSLKAAELIAEDLRPLTVSCGVPFLFIPVQDRSALGRIAVDLNVWRRYLENFWAPDLYVICFDPEQSESDLRARMFAPSLGIGEDPATGAAATALGGYLADSDRFSDGIHRWQVEQGFEMGRPSLLQVEVEKAGGRIDKIRVCGQSVMVSEGVFHCPID